MNDAILSYISTDHNRVLQVRQVLRVLKVFKEVLDRPYVNLMLDCFVY